jgi:integrase
MSDKLNPELKLADTGYWAIVWTEKTEKRYLTRSQSTRCKDRTEAEAYFADWKRADKMIAEITASPLVSDIIAEYRAEILGRDGDYNTTLENLKVLQLYLGDRRIGEIDANALRNYKIERAEPRVIENFRIARVRQTMFKTNGVNATSSNRELSILRAAFYHVRDDAKLARKLGLKLEDIPKFKIPRGKAGRGYYLKRNEEAHFHQLALEHTARRKRSKRLSRITRFVCIALDTAARTEAIEGLTWDRVDFHSGTIDFRAPGRTVTKKRRGVIAISKRLMPILKRAYGERKSDYVLDSDGVIAKSFRAWVRKTPYPKTGKHDLRRTWATLAVQAGVPIPHVADVLCDTVEVVLRHYAVHIPSDTRAAVDFRETMPEAAE